jgi:hypothetical protein
VCDVHPQQHRRWKARALPVLVERWAASFASVEDPQHVGYEEDQQYGAQPYARTPTITPAAMAVVAATAP